MRDRAGSAVLGNGFYGHFAGFRGYPGVSPGFGRPSESRYEADPDAERPAAGPIVTEGATTARLDARAAATQINLTCHPTYMLLQLLLAPCPILAMLLHLTYRNTDLMRRT